MQQFPVGTLVKLKLALTNTDTGTAVDPSSLVLKIQDPTGLQTTTTFSGGASSGPYAITKDSTGNYHALIDTGAVKAGTWLIQYGAPSGDPAQFVTAGEFQTVGIPLSPV